MTAGRLSRRAPWRVAIMALALGGSHAQAENCAMAAEQVEEARILARSGVAARFTQAERLLEKSYKLCLGDPALLQAIAGVYETMGRPTMAAFYRRAAGKLAPSAAATTQPKSLRSRDNPEPAPPQTATLEISSRPGNAQVYLNDEPKGTTSAEGKLVLGNLTEGSYRLRLSLEGYKDWIQQVALSPGKTRPIEAILAPAGPPPFAAPEILFMLRGDIHPRRVASLVSERGVDFTLTDALEKQILEAGGDEALLLAIAKAKK